MHDRQLQRDVYMQRKCLAGGALFFCLLWVLSAWKYEEYSFQQRANFLIEQELKSSNALAQSVVADLQRSLRYMQGVPFVLANSVELLQTLKSINSNSNALETLGERKKRIRQLSKNERWMSINNMLQHARDRLAFDLAFVLDRNGDSYASSDFQSTETLIGNNYSERAYYQAALKGEAGYQFALGKTSRKPGLYFSAPIYDGKQVIGVLVAKIDITRLAQDIDLTGMFLIDENGVVILAQDKQQTMKALAGSGVFHLASDQRKSLYGRDDFPILEMQAWPDRRYPNLYRLGQAAEPYVSGKVKLSERPLEVLNALPVPAILELEQEFIKVVALVSIAGCSVILILVFGVLYVRETANTSKVLQLQRNRLNEAQRLASMGSWSMDIESRQLSCSDSARWFFSIENSEVLLDFSILLAAIHRDDRDAVREEMVAAMNKMSSFHMAFRIVRPGGEIRFVVGDAVPVLETQTQRASFEGTIRDITEYQTLLNALEINENHLKRVINSCLIGIVQGNGDGYLISGNDAFAKLTGYSNEILQARQMRWEDLTPVHFHRVDQQAMMELHTDGVLPSYEKEIICEDGSVIPVLIGIARVEESEKDWVGFVLDLSERNRIARLQAEFIAIVSHELRTPLTSIRGSLSLLEAGVMGSLPEKAAQMVAVAHRNSKRLSSLVNDILDMEKLNAGKMKFEMRSLNLVNLLPQVIEANASYAENFGIRLELDCPFEQANVWSDPDRLQQVLSNLMSNAAKFSPEGDNVTIRLESLGERWKIHVTDHGPGIPEDFQSQIFSSFSQADNSDTRQKQGTGLGLKISKSMIDLMDGQIGFETSSQRGTDFWISFEKIEMPNT